MSGNWDLIIAFGLIGIIIVVFLISRIGILPRKSLPFVAAALAGAFGIALFRKYRTDRIKEDIKKLEGELENKEKRLSAIKENYNASEQKLNEMKSDLERSRDAYQKEILHINEKNKEEKELIDKLSGEELHDKFLKSFGKS